MRLNKKAELANISRSRLHRGEVFRLSTSGEENHSGRFPHKLSALALGTEKGFAISPILNRKGFATPMVLRH